MNIPESIRRTDKDGNPSDFGPVFSLCGVAFNPDGQLIGEYYNQSHAGYASWKDYAYLNTETGEQSSYKFGVKRFSKRPAHECKQCAQSIDKCQH